MSAPFFATLADGPDGGRAEWLTTSDGRRIRIGFWAPAGAKGTVFLLPGRTEYIEKYGRAAADLARRGFATLSVDWRGQGLSDRALDDPIPGHVVDFAEYQRDLQAMIAGARAQGMPEPFYLLAHSMGGCIALRGLMGAHPFQAAAFTAPMWSILIPAWQRPVAEVLSGLSTWMRFDHLYAPGTGPVIYTSAAPFAGNTLTTDPEMWAYMANHMRSEPGLALGGPTLGWLRAALDETTALRAKPSPALPAYVALGTQERIVDASAIHSRMDQWPGAEMDMYAGAEHEIMMEGPATRARFFDRMAALFNAHR